MQRPRGISVTTGLMALALIAGLVFMFSVPLPTPPPSGQPAMFDTRSFAHLILGLMVFLAVAEALCLWLYWEGRTAGRYLVLLDSLFEIAGLRSIPANLHTHPVSVVLTISKAALAVYLLWYLFQPEARAWFLHHSAEKDAPQAVPPQYIV